TLLMIGKRREPHPARYPLINYCGAHLSLGLPRRLRRVALIKAKEPLPRHYQVVIAGLDTPYPGILPVRSTSME
ncbi:MAG TPA: hypothetical protein VK558_16475, partial [Patescibacteria group bacterium]|nr:hypothetical protein [Patescibacteria group bacterium]